MTFDYYPESENDANKAEDEEYGYIFALKVTGTVGYDFDGWEEWIKGTWSLDETNNTLIEYTKFV